MNTKKIKMFFLLAIVLCGVSTAFAQTPNALVKELYKIHGEDFSSNDDRILSGKDRKLLDKFFDKTLADYIWKDLTSNSEEVGVLDFDPFYNAQDAEVKNLSVGVPKIVGTKATVIVKFTNFEKRETITYQLVRRGSVWKISDIKYSDGGGLLKYFQEAAKN